ncbi:MAG: alpha/beta fold hydrolase [Syntrophales bacterium]|nr:alpha/beta fold hydrolase [Syntrophales bacterium]MDD5233150.1 alpha/beta fold hydrolase [Syntrophales bacterium]MDD5531336.1 alpha/beta fold hydrolase [Syntrophales bacterium]
MMDHKDLSKLDAIGSSRFLFYPRPEDEYAGGAPDNSVLIPVEGAVIGARFHKKDKASPNIIFFHGNGEIAADYDDIADLFLGAGINLFVVDYRGYGRSTGTPSISSMLTDAHAEFDFFRGVLQAEAHTGPMIVMGRSLGSAPALELLASRGDKIDAAVIESGFAHSDTLLRLVGAKLSHFGLSEEDGFRNLDKIRTFGKPLLIIHAEHDEILPIQDGRDLYEASPSPDKKMLEVRGAGHNDILFHDPAGYMKSIRELAAKAVK